MLLLLQDLQGMVYMQVAAVRRLLGVGSEGFGGVPECWTASARQGRRAPDQRKALHTNNAQCWSLTCSMLHYELLNAAA